MTKDELSRQECIALSDRRAPLGIDAKGRVHHYDALTNTAWVLVDGELAHVQRGAEWDAWIDFVDERVGWDDLRATERGIGEILVDQLATAPEGCA